MESINTSIKFFKMVTEILDKIAIQAIAITTKRKLILNKFILTFYDFKNLFQ